MADGVDFKLTGLDQVLDRLSELSHDVKYRGGRFALRKAANLVAKKAKANAAKLNDPRSAADISKNIAVRWSGRTFKATGDLKFRVGVMGGAGGSARAEALASLPGGDTRHWRQLEFGNQHMAAKPFMRRSLSENIDAAISEFAKNYPKAIDRAINRAKKKQ